MGVKVTVNSVSKTRVSINNQVRDTIRTVGVGTQPTANIYLASLLDVVAVNPANNDVLVYDATLGKYVIKTLPTADGGTF